MGNQKDRLTHARPGDHLSGGQVSSRIRGGDTSVPILSVHLVGATVPSSSRNHGPAIISHRLPSDSPIHCTLLHEDDVGKKSFSSSLHVFFPRQNLRINGGTFPANDEG